MKIVFFETSHWEQEYIKNKLPGQDFVFNQGNFSEASSLPQDTEVLSIFTKTKIGDDELVRLPHLKLIATRTTGVDHINLASCLARGVVVSNVPGYGANTVAEYTFGLLLMLSRKLYQSVKRLRDQAIFDSAGLRGFDLHGKTMGIIGTGKIGAEVAKLAHAFSMNVQAYDTQPNEVLAKEVGLRYLELDELLRTSDIISLHAPAIPSTHHLLNRSNLPNLKKGAVLINTARGTLIETESLVTALRNGQISAAALDVLEEEGLINEDAELIMKGHPSETQLSNLLSDHELMRMDNVYLTPHNAFNTTEAIKRILDTTIENILSFSKGIPLNNVK